MSNLLNRIKGALYPNTQGIPPEFQEMKLKPVLSIKPSDEIEKIPLKDSKQIEPVQLLNHPDTERTSAPILLSPGTLRQKEPEKVEKLIIDLHNETFALHKEELILEKDHITQMNEKIHQLLEDFLEEVRKRGKEILAADYWQDLQKYAQYALSFSSLVLAGTFLSIGYAPASASLMLLSAGLGLFNQGMQDTKGYEALAGYLSENKASQKNIANMMEAFVVFLSLGIGLYQMCVTVPEGIQYVANLENAPKLNALKNVESLVRIASTVFLQATNHYYLSKNAEYQETSKIYEAKKTFLDNKSSQSICHLESSVKNQESVTKAIKSALNNLPTISK